MTLCGVAPTLRRKETSQGSLRIHPEALEDRIGWR